MSSLSNKNVTHGGRAGKEMEGGSERKEEKDEDGAGRPSQDIERRRLGRAFQAGWCEAT